MEIRAAREEDAPGIAAIYNDAVAHSTAIWNDELVDATNRATWLTAHRDLGYPVLVAAEDDRVLGYATFGDWRAFDGYRHTVEHSVYVHADARGRGLGRTLMVALIDEARRLGKHVMVAGIDASNTGSIQLHERLGFTSVGLLPQVGMKFGRWLDLAFLQLTLDGRPAPDGPAGA